MQIVRPAPTESETPEVEHEISALPPRHPSNSAEFLNLKVTELECGQLEFPKNKEEKKRGGFRVMFRTLNELQPSCRSI